MTNSAYELASNHEKLVLGFDAGCSTCRDLAGEVEKQSDGKVEVRNLWDPQVMQWRREALGDEAPWTPTLLKIKEGKVKGWTGWRLGAVLSSSIGPVSTWRLMHALGEVAKTNKTDYKSSDDASIGYTRRQLLKGGMSGAVVALGIVSGTGGFARSAAAEEPGSVQAPASTGSRRDQRRAITTVRSSSEYKTLVRRHKQRTRTSANSAGDPFDLRRATVNVSEGYAIVVLPAYSRGSTAKGTIGTFFVDLERREVGSYRSLELASENQEIQVAFREDGKLLESVVFEGGYVTSSNGQRVSTQSYIQELNNKLSDSSGSGEPTFSTQAVGCAFAIRTICGFGVAGNCYAVAVFLGIATAGIAGFSLAAVCAAIGAFGCGAAEDRLCG